MIDDGSGAATRCCDPMRLPRRRAQIGLACRVIGRRCARPPGAQLTSPDQDRHATSGTRSCASAGKRETITADNFGGVSPKPPRRFLLCKSIPACEPGARYLPEMAASRSRAIQSAGEGRTASVTIYPLRRAARWEAKALGLLGDHEAMRHVRAHWSVDLQIKAVRLQAASRVREAERACAAEVARWEEVRDNLMARVRLSDAAEVRRALREAGVGLPPPVPRRNAEVIRLADWIRQHNPDPVLPAARSDCA